MATDVVLPQMGLEVSEGTVVTLHVAVGARVAEGDPLLEVETDKALTDVVAPHDGVVVAVEVQEGDTVAVGTPLVRLGEGDEDEAAAGRPEPVGATAADGAPKEPRRRGEERRERELVGVGAAGDGTAAAAGSRVAPLDTGRGAHRIRAAPVARRAARHLGVALTDVAGTGPRGRITLADVERAAQAGTGVGPTAQRSGGAATAPAPAPAEAAAAPGSGARLEPLSATRRAIARRMVASAQIPQFTLERDVDATWLLAEKARLSAAGPVRVGVTDLLVQALAEAVARHRDLAACWVPAADGAEPQLRRRDGVDVGLAVASHRGLLVPVLRGAHERGLGELALDRSRPVGAAREGRLDLAQMTGATITLSSLAAFGIDRFAAMLNPGESAILAVGRTVERVVPRDRGLAVVPTLTLTMTLDHRVVDGATGAAALAELADLLEGGMPWRT